MSDTVFRTKVEPTVESSSKLKPADDKAVPVGETEVEPPYTDYHKEKGHSFILDYYDVGELIDPRIFESEVNDIESYLDHQINKGEVNNTLESVRNEMKRIEKLVNVKRDARKSMKMALVAEYTNFLLKAEGIKRGSAKFGLI